MALPPATINLFQFVDNFAIEATPLGACCLEFQGCRIVAPAEHCSVLGGVYEGDGSTCAASPGPAAEGILATHPWYYGEIAARWWT